MEKRVFIAFILSFLVLYFWSASLPKRTPPVNKSQDIVNKDFSINKPTLEQAERFVDTKMPVILDVIDEVFVLENQRLRLEFSNIGGTLKKAIIKTHKAQLPLTNILGIEQFDQLPFSVSQKLDDLIVFRFSDSEKEIIKEFSLDNENYIVHSNITVKNMTNLTKDLNLDIYAYKIDMSNLKEDPLSHDKSLYEYVGYTDKNMHRKNNAFKFTAKENREIDEKINWLGFRDRYYCLIAKPLTETSIYSVQEKGEHKLTVGTKIKNYQLEPHEKIELPYIVYNGPERIEDLKKVKYDFEKIKKYYKFELFDAIAKLMNNVLLFIHKLIPNWGVCIILMSLIVYFATYPLTASGMASMKRMQSLQPKMAAIKEKYKNNPQKMNAEMVGLYKEHKINPMGGCLPFLFQMPVFIGIYQVLWREVDFNGATFLWIKDLSMPDRLITFKTSLPFVGNELNILPLIMVVVMFYQQKFSSKAMVITDPMQASHQKMMGIMMPLLLGFVFYKFASGLAIYFTMFYLLSTLTQWKMSKQTIVV